MRIKRIQGRDDRGRRGENTFKYKSQIEEEEYVINNIS
jgi:hypothetical protein